ncbi:MAG: hypothetical protein IH787_06180 [Nitrospirae bacterium]|nr:hypothetical protein [Nitrospirota bacterium]
MFGCIFLVTALAAPRLVLLFVWILTNFVQNAYGSILVPILGFFFMPLTTLVYALAAPGGPGTLGWVLVATAVTLDIMAYTGAYGTRRRFWVRIPEYDET